MINSAFYLHFYPKRPISFRCFNNRSICERASVYVSIVYAMDAYRTIGTYVPLLSVRARHGKVVISESRKVVFEFFSLVPEVKLKARGNSQDGGCALYSAIDRHQSTSTYITDLLSRKLEDKESGDRLDLHAYTHGCGSRDYEVT